MSMSEAFYSSIYGIKPHALARSRGGANGNGNGKGGNGKINFTRSNGATHGTDSYVIAPVLFQVVWYVAFVYVLPFLLELVQTRHGLLE